MLKSIRRLDRKVRADLLATLAINIGRPVVASDIAVHGEDSAQREKVVDVLRSFEALGKQGVPQLEVLREIIERIRLGSEDDFETSKARILEFIGKEIRDLTIGSDQIANVRKRLGQKGMLPPASYKIKYSAEFSELCQTMGMTRQEVREVISSPDMFEHFLPEVQSSSDEAISLYAKMYRNKQSTYSLLIDARRVEDEVTVHYGMRIFHDDVDLSDVSKPLDVLQAFIERFGEEIILNDQVGKLFIYKAMPIGATRFDIGLPSHVRGVDVRESHRLLAGGVVEIVIAYGVNLSKYADSLRRHGIRIKRDGV